MKWMRCLALTAIVVAGCGGPELCMRSSLAEHIGLPVGAEATLRAGGIDLLAECDLPAPGNLQWASTDTTIARVDGTGTVRGIAPGRAVIVATSGRFAVRTAIEVIPTVARVEITPRDTTIMVGDTIVFRATAFGTAGEPLPSIPAALTARDMWKAAGHGDDAVVYNNDEPGPYPAPFLNRLSLRGWREGATHVVAEVVGASDSVMIRVRR